MSMGFGDVISVAGLCLSSKLLSVLPRWFAERLSATMPTYLVWNLFNPPQMKKLHPLGYSKLLKLVHDIPSEAVSKSLVSQRKTKIVFATAKQCVTREKFSPGPCGETAGALAGKRVWQQSPKAACFCKTWQSIQFCCARIGCPVPLYCFLVTASFLLLSRSLCKHSNRAEELKCLMPFFFFFFF